MQRVAVDTIHAEDEAPTAYAHMSFLAPVVPPEPDAASTSREDDASPAMLSWVLAEADPDYDRPAGDAPSSAERPPSASRALFATADAPDASSPSAEAQADEGGLGELTAMAAAFAGLDPTHDPLEESDGPAQAKDLEDDV